MDISSDLKQEELNKSRKTKTIFLSTECKRCGNIWDTDGGNIGRIKSCGCYKRTKWMDTAEKHIGEKHNSLTITGVDWERTKKTKEDKSNKVNEVFYFTKCDCGKIPQISAAYNSLKTGHIKSCGCSKINNPLIMEDLTGMTFGRLTVIRRDIERDMKRINKGKNGNAHWLCQCSCGNPKLSSVVGYQLKTGKTTSCGCYNSEMIAERNRKYSSKYNHHGKLKDNKPVPDENGIIKIYDENDEFYFTISEEDFDVVSKYYWRKIDSKTESNERKRYWITNAKADDIKNGSSYSLRLHQIIAEQKYGKYDHSEFVPDHLDRNPDNNTRNNLILKTNIENSHNRGLSCRNKSGKTGVYQRKDTGKWVANIMVNYKNIYLGEFYDYESAVNKRLEAEKEYGFTCDNIKPKYDLLQ